MAFPWSPADEPALGVLLQFASPTDPGFSSLSEWVVPSSSWSSSGGGEWTTVVTLNLTSVSDLIDLLAGLVDNNTVGTNGHSGVSGHFEDVTRELATLGRNPLVMGSLVNASQPDTGTYGMPFSEAPPPKPAVARSGTWTCASRSEARSGRLAMGTSSPRNRAPRYRRPVHPTRSAYPTSLFGY